MYGTISGESLCTMLVRTRLATLRQRDTLLFQESRFQNLSSIYSPPKHNALLIPEQY